MKYQPRSKWAPQYPGWNTGRSVAPLDPKGPPAQPLRTTRWGFPRSGLRGLRSGLGRAGRTHQRKVGLLLGHLNALQLLERWFQLPWRPELAVRAGLVHHLRQNLGELPSSLLVGHAELLGDLRDLLVSEDLRHLVPGYWCVRSGSNPRVRLRSEALLLESGEDLLQPTAREQPAEDRWRRRAASARSNLRVLPRVAPQLYNAAVPLAHTFTHIAPSPSPARTPGSRRPRQALCTAAAGMWRTGCRCDAAVLWWRSCWIASSCGPSPNAGSWWYRRSSRRKEDRR